MNLPVEYGGMIGDPGEPLRHFIKDATGKAVVFSDSFEVDYSGGDLLMKFLVKLINENPAAYLNANLPFTPPPPPP